MVDGDNTRLRQIIDNVLSNAMKYTPDGGRVTVTVTRQDGAVVCAVADTGIGIPTADQDRLFTRFDRTSNAIASGTLGTGLGLAVTKALVEHHHGTIDTPAAPTTAPPSASPYPHTSTARSDAARPPAVSHNC